MGRDVEVRQVKGVALMRFVGGPWDGQSREMGDCAKPLRLPALNPKASSGRDRFIVVEYVRTDAQTMTCTTEVGRWTHE